MEVKKRKVAIIAGSRGEYGYFRPIIEEIEKREDMDYAIVVTNMHLLESFGASIEQIKKDNFKIAATVHNTIDGYNHITMVKSLAVFMLQLPEIINQMGADFILISGDRGEQMVAAMAGAHMYIPVAHIQAGEVSGNIDGTTRHAITKYAHIHFAANDDAAQRLLKMGEQEHRVHNVGAPMLDELVNGRMTPQDEIIRKYSLQPDGLNMLFVYHSTTEEIGDLDTHMDEVMSAVCSFDGTVTIILNNSDAGSGIVRRKIQEHRKSNMKIYPNIPREDYAGLMNVVDLLVGNSSSGLIEAPTFGLPVVNIGNRQNGRVQGENVINVGCVREEIQDAIQKALDPSFKEKLKNCKNPYGDGNSSRRIVDVLGNISIDEDLLVKKITY